MITYEIKCVRVDWRNFIGSQPIDTEDWEPFQVTPAGLDAVIWMRREVEDE